MTSTSKGNSYYMMGLLAIALLCSNVGYREFVWLGELENDGQHLNTLSEYYRA